MADEVPLFYWDADVFLSYIEEVSERLPDIDALLETAEKGNIEIITSTFTIVEVAFHKFEKDKKALDLEMEEKIGKLWTSPAPVKLVEFHMLVAEKAKGLIRGGLPEGWSLKPGDAIHLATAQHMNVKAFHTYNDELDKYAERVGFSVERPLIGQLPLFLPSATPGEAEQEA